MTPQLTGRPEMYDLSQVSRKKQMKGGTPIELVYKGLISVQNRVLGLAGSSAFLG